MYRCRLGACLNAKRCTRADSCGGGVAPGGKGRFTYNILVGAIFVKKRRTNKLKAKCGDHVTCISLLYIIPGLDYKGYPINHKLTFCESLK